VNQDAFPRPRVTDFQAQDPIIVEQIGTEERIRSSIKLPIGQLSLSECAAELYKKKSKVFYDMGADYFHYDPETGKLFIYRYVGGHLKTRLLSGLPDDMVVIFNNYIEKINKTCRELFEKQKQAIEEKMKIGKAYKRKFEKAVEDFKRDFNKVATETAEAELQRIQKPHIPTPEEKEKKLDMPTWPGDDIKRSLKVASNTLAAAKKAYKKADMPVLELDNQIKKHMKEIERLETLLATDLSKNDFRISKTDLEFHQQQITIIKEKMLPHFDETMKFHNQIVETEKLIAMLQCCQNANELKTNVKVNYPRKVQRVRDRLEKLEQERVALETKRENLNARWKEVSGHDKDIIAPLCLRSGAKAYFV